MVLVRSLLVTVGLVVAYYLLPMDSHSTLGASAVLAAGLAGVVAVFVWEVLVISRSPHPRLKAVEALATTLPLFLLLFASAYYLLDRSDAAAFTAPLTRTDALYFTLTTFTTVGYGDITARTETGRVLVMLQMTGGLLLVGVAARVLTTAIQAGLRQQRRNGTPPEPPGQHRDGPPRPE
ncbi:potassium channel family protein [Streptomyces sp. NPDC020801]|uniref:potassium channel family protein n=1 Tax=unclassified Streptomyces TaxID=2593676 RepID=UPI003798369C